MRRIVPVLLCTVALLFAGGAWIGNLPQQTGSSTMPRVLKPEAKTTKALDVETPTTVPATMSLLSITDNPGGGTPVVIIPSDNPSDTLHYDGPNYNAIGLTAGGTFSGAVRFTPTTGCTLVNVLWYANTIPTWASVVTYGPGTNTTPGATLDSFGFTVSAGTTWYSVPMPTPRRLPSGQDFWVCIKVNHPALTWPLGVDFGPQIRERGGFMRIGNGDWAELYEYNLDYNWNIRAEVEPESVPQTDMAVTAVNVTSPIQPNQWTTIRATVANLGLDTIFPGETVKLQIAGPGSYVYNDVNEVTADTLLFGDTEEITFAPNWNTQDTTGIYTVTVWTEFTGDLVHGNDTVTAFIDVTLWLTYANWSATQYTTWDGPQRGTMFYATEFGLSYPVTVESLRAYFNWNASYPWDDSTFRFIVYGGDLSTKIDSSPWLEAVDGISTYATGGIELTDTTTRWLVAIEPFGDSGFPSSYGDGDHDSRSIYGDPTGWFYWISGELFIASYVTFSGVTDDVGFYGLDAPYMHVEPGQPVTPTGWARNYGITNQVAVACTAFVVDTVTDAIIYTGATTVSLDAGDTAQVTFPSWTAPTGNNYYQVYMFTYLVGDENPGNNGITHLFMGFGVTNPLLCPPLTAAVTFDGILNTAEWADAYVYDVSNIYGWNDIYRWFPGNVMLYTKYDAQYVYFGIDLPYISTHEDMQVGLYFDENNDGAWNGDSSEGNYWYRSYNDTMRYRSLPDYWLAPGQQRGLHAASSVSGTMQAEIAVPIGTAKHELDISTPEDTLGFYMYHLLEAYSEMSGWWHTLMDSSSWNVPARYGKLVLTADVGSPDAGVSQITAPTNWYDTSVTITPAVKIRNYGDTEMTFDAWFIIDDGTDAEVYRQSVIVSALGVGEQRDVVFADWAAPHVEGSYNGLCSLAVNDDNSGNDMLDEDFTIMARPPWSDGWHEVASMPLTSSGKPVKRGGWLALHGDGMIYATKGYKTSDFYRYDPLGDSWTELADVPPGMEGKLPQKGCKGISDGDNLIYMTKGYNTYGYWQYNIATDTWTALPNVPEGVTRKKVKGGTDLVYVTHDSVDYVYMLKGYRTEFWRYNVGTATWESRADAPTGIKYKWDKGSWIVARGGQGQGHGAGTIYAHKAKYYNRATYKHEFWKYDIPGDTWYTTPLAGMPLYGLHSGRIKKKKAKDGGAGAKFGNEIYALKGGNTQQFWMYDIPADTWTEQDTVPNNGSTMRKKRVKYGADLVHWGGGAFFALKGNKTREMWRYVLPAAMASQPGRSGVMGGVTKAGPLGVTLAPNPLTGGFATLRYSLPMAGPATIHVFDVTGRSVVKRTVLATLMGAVSLDVRSLSAGIYLVRFDTDGYTATQKLVVQK